MESVAIETCLVSVHVSLCPVFVLCVRARAAVLEAVQKWRTEKEARLSGDKPEEDEEEESIYSAHHEEVSLHEYPGWCPRSNQVDLSWTPDWLTFSLTS